MTGRPGAAAGAPTVTGLPGSPAMLLEDPAAAHQIQVTWTAGGAGVTVSCNCISRRNMAGEHRAPRKVIATVTSPDVAILVWAYLEWHDAHKLELAEPCSYG